MLYEVLARRASPTLHCYIHRRTHSRKAPSFILDRLQETAAEPPPLCRRLRKNQEKAQQQSAFPKLSVAPISCQLQKTPTDGQAEDCIRSLGKGVPVPLGKAEFPSGKVSVSKPSRSRKGESRKQKLGSHGDVKENTDSSLDAKLSASKADVNTFELVAGKHHGAKVEYNELLRKAKLVEGLCPTEVASLLKKRAFRSCSYEQFETMLKFLEEYHASSERALKVLVMNAGVLSHPVDLLQQKLQVFVDFQIEKETIGKLCTTIRILTTSVGSLQAKLAFLEELGLDVEVMNKIFYGAPCAISYSLKGLKRTLDFLSGMGVDKGRFVQLVCNCPQLLWVSCNNNLIPRYHFFQQVGIPAVHFPRLICLSSRSSIDTLRARMQSIKELGFSHEDVCSMVGKAPELLRSKVEKLELALNYLVHERKYDKAEIVKFPRGLLSSLEDRIMPRCRLAEEYGLVKVYSLASILSYPEARFKKLLRKSSDWLNERMVS